MISTFLIHLIATIFIEGLLIGIFLRTQRIVVASVLLNICIHPLTWFAYYYILSVQPNHFISLLWLEVGIAVTEGVILSGIFKVYWQQVLLTGIIANYCSFIVGMLLF